MQISDASVFNFSVVVPVYNSAGTVLQVLEQLMAMAQTTGERWQFIFVNDGSTDTSFTLLQQATVTAPHQLLVVDLARNYGQHSATCAGILKAEGQWIITLDDDLQVLPADIPLLLQKQHETQAAIVYGQYVQKKHSGFRNWGSRMLNRCMAWAGNPYGQITSFRLFHHQLKNAFERINPHIVFIDEVLRSTQLPIAFARVTHYPRSTGQSGYGLGKMLALTFQILFYHTALPLQILTYLGICISVICFIIGLSFMYKKWMFDVPLGYTSLIVAIFFSTGILMFALGIIGAYIRRIYLSQQGRQELYIRKIVCKSCV